jgi:hypothetical protein
LSGINKKKEEQLFNCEAKFITPTQEYIELITIYIRQERSKNKKEAVA